jgi:flagellar hook-basal body complex protein FliE
MSIEGIAAVSAATEAIKTAGISSPLQQNAASASHTFDSLVTTLQDLSGKITSNQQSVESLAAGNGEELHRVVMNMESTKLAFDLALQVRNRTLEAYQELMRMQI